MLRRAESIAITILWLGLGGNLAFAQAPVGSILHVEIVNSTLYRRGYCSIIDQGKDPKTSDANSFTPISRRTQIILNSSWYRIAGCAAYCGVVDVAGIAP